MVRLKDCKLRKREWELKKFQFLMVRLKVFEKVADKNSIIYFNSLWCD